MPDKYLNALELFIKQKIRTDKSAQHVKFAWRHDKQAMI